MNPVHNPNGNIPVNDRPHIRPLLSFFTVQSVHFQTDAVFRQVGDFPVAVSEKHTAGDSSIPQNSAALRQLAAGNIDIQDLVRQQLGFEQFGKQIMQIAVCDFVTVAVLLGDSNAFAPLNNANNLSVIGIYPA